MISNMDMFNIGPTYKPATRYLFWAYHEKEVSYEDAYSILVSKYRFGKYGAEEALDFVRTYPHMIHKPLDYDEYRSKVNGSL